MISAASEAAMRSRHLREIEDQENHFRDKKNRTRANLDASYEDAKESVRAQHQAPLRHAGQRRDAMPTAEQHQRDRVDAIGALNEEHEAARKTLAERHKQELSAARAKPAAPMPSGQPPGPHDPLHSIWHQLGGAQRQRYFSIKEKYAQQRTELNTKQGATRERTARYDHEAVLDHAHDRNVTEHLKVNEQEHKELQQLASSLKAEMASEDHRRAEHARERSAVDAKYAH